MSCQSISNLVQEGHNYIRTEHILLAGTVGDRGTTPDWSADLGDWVGRERTASSRRLDLEAATDLLWLYMSPDVYHLLVHGRSWTPEHYETWIADTLTSALLPYREF